MADSLSQLCAAATAGSRADVAVMLSSGGVAAADASAALQIASARGYAAIVDSLLAVGGADPASHHNGALIAACEHGHASIVALLLPVESVDPMAATRDGFPVDARDPRINHDGGFMSPLTCAARNGHLAVVEVLLGDGRLQLTVEGNRALTAAASEGRLAVVQRLVADPRMIDPHLHRAVAAAAAGGHVDVVLALLALPTMPAAAHHTALAKAAKAGHLPVVEALLSTRRIDPAHLDNAALQLAAQLGNAALVASLLDNPRVIDAPGRNLALNAAVRGGHVAVVGMLLERARITPGHVIQALDVAMAAQHAVPEVPVAAGHAAAAAGRAAAAAGDDTVLTGHADIVQLLLAHPDVAADEDNDVSGLVWTAENGHVALLQQILRGGSPHLGHICTYALGMAAANGHLAVLEALLALPGLQPADNFNFALRCAAQFGQAAAMHRLLREEAVVAADGINAALHSAATHEQWAIVESLLSDGRAAFGMHDDVVLRRAAGAGHLKLVQQLLLDSRVDPTAKRCDAVKRAAENGYYDVVDALLADARVAAASQCLLEWAFGDASMQNAGGNEGLAARLLNVPHFDPSERGDFAIKMASRAGWAGVVDRLLADHRVSPVSTDGSLSALDYAVKQRQVAVVDILLKDSRVDPRAAGHRAVYTALRSASVEALRRLLADPRVTFKAPKATAAGRDAAVAAAAASGDTGSAAGTSDDGAIDAGGFFAEAAVSSELDVLRCLLEDGRFDPAAKSNAALREALTLGGEDKATCLFACAAVRAELSRASDGFALQVAATFGDLALVELILGSASPDIIAASGVLALLGACRKGHWPVVERLLCVPSIHEALLSRDSRLEKSVLQAAARGGSVVVLERLLQRYNCAPHGFKGGPLCIAATEGHVAMVERLLADPRVDPTADGYASLVAAVGSQHPDGLAVLDRLLADPRVNLKRRSPLDPSFSEPLRAAFSRGSIAAIDRLLALPAVDSFIREHPLVDLFACIEERLGAAGAGRPTSECTAAVRRLLAFPEVPRPSTAGVLQTAACRGLTDIVDALLADDLLPPSRRVAAAAPWISLLSEAAAASASQAGSVDASARLLADPRVHGPASRASALVAACLPRVKSLLADPGVRPSALRHKFVSICRIDPSDWTPSYDGIADELCADARLLPQEDSNSMLRLAAFYRVVPLVERLLRMEAVTDALPDMLPAKLLELLKNMAECRTCMPWPLPLLRAALRTPVAAPVAAALQRNLDVAGIAAAAWARRRAAVLGRAAMFVR